jgi:hypothetical protein
MIAPVAAAIGWQYHGEWVFVRERFANNFGLLVTCRRCTLELQRTRRHMIEMICNDEVVNEGRIWCYNWYNKIYNNGIQINCDSCKWEQNMLLYLLHHSTNALE